MSPESVVRPRQNYLIVSLLLLATFFAAHFEGYLPKISFLFWLSLSVGFALAFWLASFLTTNRLLALLLSIFVMEYIKESNGITYGLWIYHGLNRFYLFGVWAWVLGGLAAFTLATRLIIRRLRKLQVIFPRWFPPVIVFLIFLLIPLTLGKYWGGVGPLFWLFYAVLLGIGVVSASRMDFPLFAGLVLTAWIVGNLSEFLGSVSSNVWTFPYDPHYPPFYLVAACWPLEILGQYALSALLAGEPLEAYTLS